MFMISGAFTALNMVMLYFFDDTEMISKATLERQRKAAISIHDVDKTANDTDRALHTQVDTEPTALI
jgi:hypothetical protein